MVAFGFLPRNCGRWWGPMNGTLSFYECRFSGGCHEVVVTLKRYLMQKNLFELFALRGSGDTKTSGASAHTDEPPLWNFQNTIYIVY